MTVTQTVSRNNRKVRTGTVLKSKMNKTVVVEVERLIKHPMYKKIMRRTKRIKAHNENLTLQVGDRVKIESTRPISKEKHYKVVKKIIRI